MAAGDRTVHGLFAALAGDDGGTIRRLGLNADGALRSPYPYGAGVESDTDDNDADKLFTVPAGHIWIVRWIHVSYVATATAGNRYLQVDVRDASDVIICRLLNGHPITASQTERITFGPIPVDDSTPGSVVTYAGLPATLFLRGGYDLRVYDTGTVDIAADDMHVFIGREELAFT